MTAEDEAKQLDSVTDRHQEKDFDESKAKEAMSALTSNTAAGRGTGGKNSATGKDIKVTKEDVAVIVAELEVTEDEAKAALRSSACDGKTSVAAALRKLVAS